MVGLHELMVRDFRSGLLLLSLSVLVVLLIVAANVANEILSRFDAVIAPTWPNGAALREVRDGWPIPARMEWEPEDDADAQTPRLNYIANLVGHPGLAIPCGFDEDRMPLSLQIVGSPMDDQGVLDFGTAFQRETDWHRRRPPYPWRA